MIHGLPGYMPGSSGLRIVIPYPDNCDLHHITWRIWRKFRFKSLVCDGLHIRQTSTGREWVGGRPAHSILSTGELCTWGRGQQSYAACEGKLHPDMKGWTMKQTSLRGIANKAASDKAHRLQNLFGMLPVGFLLWGWQFVNKRAANGVDRQDALPRGGVPVCRYADDSMPRRRTGGRRPSCSRAA